MQKISEQELRNIIAESINGYLCEIGNTIPGQWMLGRLAGRQENRKNGDNSKGKIKNTTVDAYAYANKDNHSPNPFWNGSNENYIAFWNGYDLEDNDAYENDFTDGFGHAMKQVIRGATNEDKLKAIVSESIKRTLNELDWKTYANAAKIARKDSDWGLQNSRYNIFRRKAAEEFNKAYGYSSHAKLPDDYPWHNEDDTSHLDFSEVYADPEYICRDDFSNVKGRKYYKVPEDFDWNNDPPFYDIYSHGKNNGQVITPEKFFKGSHGGENAAKAYRNAQTELDNYKNGNYEYSHEKGWHLRDK